ncbi:EthD family reductase [Sphingomonas immobilis]|uniref:EthD family reductase n=1 Tax=Sphingomonas immobilis TaxID=3063997 RepID=A0ABT9A265_9SPHN|nr:EthD family reductase [Sphingomonas sp. CA1-15]MDO7843916.1 EthD family reductase [Sphingomonas sp. CA1-15]
MTTFVVTYPRGSGSTFDTGYYVERHIPLVQESWGPYGLTSATALIPEGAAPPYTALALLKFADGAALDAALAAPEAATVFGDVPNFTNIAPVAVRCEAR